MPTVFWHQTFASGIVHDVSDAQVQVSAKFNKHQGLISKHRRSSWLVCQSSTNFIWTSDEKLKYYCTLRVCVYWIWVLMGECAKFGRSFRKRP